MADYFTQLVVQPEIPAHLLDEETRARLEVCGLTCAHDEKADTYYVFSQEYASYAHQEAETAKREIGERKPAREQRQRSKHSGSDPKAVRCPRRLFLLGHVNLNRRMGRCPDCLEW